MKKFGGVVALEDVSLKLEKGKVNALIGENGAGKSTLMKILSGVHTEYEGEIVFQGKSVRFANPRDAQNQGIAIIHQELNLIPNLSVAENIFLGREMLTRWGMLDKGAMHARTLELLDRLKLKVDPDVAVSELKVGQQQVVEIAKTLLTDSEVIIMDEPTSAISESEVSILFDIVEDLRKEGKTIVYISHKLEELFKISDRYIVLRDGRFVGSGNITETTADELIQMMAGRNTRVIQKDIQEIGDEVLLSVRDVTLKNSSVANRNLLSSVSFDLRKGEILGIYGLMGAGRTELLETLFGMHANHAKGKIFVEGKEISFKSPTDAIDAGLALVPEDRKSGGLVLNMEVQENISMAVLKEVEEWGFLKKNKEVALAEKYINELRIKTPSSYQAVKNLSGGNQQKVVLAKWLASNPKVLMLDEPTRGIDVNAKNEIYKLILGLAEKGLGIILVSSEIPEVLALSDRILAMSEGTVTAEFSRADVSENSLLKASLPRTI